MITIIFNPLSVSFIPVNLTIDVIAFFYDLGLALITGYVIWFKTDELVQRKDELRKYRDEQQELSRYLGRLSHAVECYTGGDERQRYTIEDLLENGPVRSAFVPQSDEEAHIFQELSCVCGSIQSMTVKNCSPSEPLRLSRLLNKLRAEFLSWPLIQPKVHFLKIWGLPATAENSRKASRKNS